MDTNDDTKDKNNDDDLAAMYDGFRKRLLEELGVDKMNEEDKKATEEKLEQLINTRIVNLIMIYTPEEDAKELDDIIQKEKQQELVKFIAEKIPGFGEKVASDLMALRDELVHKLQPKNEK